MNPPLLAATPATSDVALSTVEALDKRLSDFIEREERRKHWKDVIIPVASAVVALTGILAGASLQITTIHSQNRLKQYEVTFLAKQKAYAQVMASLHSFFFQSAGGSDNEMLRAVDTLQRDIFAIQPFLSSTDQAVLWERTMQFTELCLNHHRDRATSSPAQIDELTKSFTDQRDKIREMLNRLLFSSNSNGA